MINKIGYPYSYGDELTPKIAGNNRKQAVSYSVLIPSISRARVFERKLRTG